MAIPTRKTSSRSLGLEERSALLRGWGGFAHAEPGNELGYMRRRWSEHRKRLLRFWTSDPDEYDADAFEGWAFYSVEPAGPGHRPWAWWEFDAPEPRRILYRSEQTRTCDELDITPSRGVRYWFGKPSTYRGWDPGEPPIIEAEVTYLARHDLLTDREWKLLKEGELETRPYVHKWSAGCPYPERVPEDVEDFGAWIERQYEGLGERGRASIAWGRRQSGNEEGETGPIDPGGTSEDPATTRSDPGSNGGRPSDKTS